MVRASLNHLPDKADLHILFLKGVVRLILYLYIAVYVAIIIDLR